VGADGSNGHYGGAVGGDGAYWEGNTLVIEIPNIQQAASFLIGKKGVVIEKLQDTHNCKIQIEKEPLGEAPLRKVFVTSHISRDNCERCAEGIAKKMVEFTELQGQKSVPPNFRAPQAAAGGFCGGFNSGGMGGGINADMNMMANQGFGVPGMGNGGGTMGHMSYAPGGMGGGFACGMGGGAGCCDSSMGVGGGMTKLHTDMLEMMQGMQSGGGMSGGGMQGGGCSFGAGVEPSTMQQQQQQHMQHHVQMQMQGDMQMARMMHEQQRQPPAAAVQRAAAPAARMVHEQPQQRREQPHHPRGGGGAAAASQPQEHVPSHAAPGRGGHVADGGGGRREGYVPRECPSSRREGEWRATSSGGTGRANPPCTLATSDIEGMVTRERARKERDFELADQIRLRMREEGVRIEDQEHTWYTTDGRSGRIPLWDGGGGAGGGRGGGGSGGRQGHTPHDRLDGRRGGGPVWDRRGGYGQGKGGYGGGQQQRWGQQPGGGGGWGAGRAWDPRAGCGGGGGASSY